MALGVHVSGGCIELFAGLNPIDVSDHSGPILSSLNSFLKDAQAVFISSIVFLQLSLLLSLQQQLISLALASEGVALFLISIGAGSLSVTKLILDYLRGMLPVSLYKPECGKMSLVGKLEVSSGRGYGSRPGAIDLDSGVRLKV